MVNDLGPGSVGGRGGGRRGKAQNGMNSRKTSTSEASLAVEWRLHGFPYGSQIFFRRHPPVMWGRDDAEQHFLCTNTPDPPRREDNFPLEPPPRVSHCFVY